MNDFMQGTNKIKILLGGFIGNAIYQIMILLAKHLPCVVRVTKTLDLIITTDTNGLCQKLAVHKRFFPWPDFSEKSTKYFK